MNKAHNFDSMHDLIQKPNNHPWALITGSAKRIGKAIAIALAHQQYNIIIHYHQADQEAKTLAETIHQLGCQTLVTSLDLSQTDQIANWCKDLIKQISQIDLVVHNASSFINNNINTIQLEDLYRDINLHAITPLLIAQQLKIYGQPKHIINMLDTNVNNINTDYLSYHLSKQMLKQLTFILAKSLAPLTRVNAICPGPILMPAGINKHENPNYLANKIAQMPLYETNKNHNPEKENLHFICEAINYLNQAKQTTGQMLMIDRGNHLL